MKLVFFDQFQLGVLTNDEVVDVMPAVKGLTFDSPQELIEKVILGWDSLRMEIERVAQEVSGVPVTSVRLRAPIPRPGQLVCLAGNYIEPKKPERGLFNAFLKASTSVIGIGDTVELPEAPVTWFHFEPEFALVIGKTASHVKASEAMDHVFGYTQFMDVSARGLPGGFFLGKSWHTFGPMGPALVTADEVPDPNARAMKMWVSDELRHDFSTREMDRHIPELLEEVTKVMTLEPGNVVSTGTHHFGLQPVGDGDVVRLQIQGLGPDLVVSVHDPLKRTKWGES